MTSVDADVAAPPDGTDSGRKKLVGVVLTWARRVLLVVVVAVALWTLVRNWPTVSATLKTVPWGITVFSQLAVIVGIIVGTLAWQTMLNGLGKPVSVLRGAQINLVGQLGKYVPGSLWAYLLQMELGRKAGVGRTRVFTASLIQVGVGLVSALMIGVLALPVMLRHTPGVRYLFILLPIGLVLLHPKILTKLTNLALKILRRAPLAEPLTYAVVLKSLALQLLSFACLGAHLFLLARAVGAAPGITGFLLCAGAISVGLTAGMFFFVLPSGAGIRDGVIVAVLISALPYSQALAFAVVSRVMFILADVITAGLAALLARWHAPLP